MFDRVQNKPDSEQVFARTFLVNSSCTKFSATVVIHIFAFHKSISESVLKNYFKMFSEASRIPNAAMSFLKSYWPTDLAMLLKPDSMTGFFFWKYCKPSIVATSWTWDIDW